jgi:MFS family permease
VKTASALREFRNLDRAIWLLAGVRAANTMALALVFTFLGVHIVTERGETAFFFGTLMLGAYVCQSVAQAWAGELSDRVGRVRIMSMSLIARAVALLILGVIIEAHSSIAWLVPAIIASGVLRGLFEPVSYAMVSERSTDESRVAALSLQRIGINLGWAVGPVSGGLLSTVMPFGQIFYVTALVIFLSGLAVSRLQE